MLDSPKQPRPSQPLRMAKYTTGPLRLTLEGVEERNGEWLLGEFARANQRAMLPLVSLKKPWWRFW